MITFLEETTSFIRPDTIRTDKITHTYIHFISAYLLKIGQYSSKYLNNNFSQALDEALKQKSILQKRFESEFNQLRNVNTAQEQQLLDDFEWKLREVEQSCKKKILEADKCKRDLEAQVTKLKAEVEEVRQE